MVIRVGPSGVDLKGSLLVFYSVGSKGLIFQLIQQHGQFGEIVTNTVFD